MLSATHMIGGAAAAAAVLLFNPDIQAVPTLITAVGVGVVGGLIPDIDHPKSRISKALRPVNALVSFLFSHRGVFHTPALYFLLYALWVWKCPASKYTAWGNCLFAGILSHILLDCFNPGGIPLFFPLSSRRIHFAKIKTGGRCESVIRVLLGGAAGILVVLMFLQGTGINPGIIISRFSA